MNGDLLAVRVRNILRDNPTIAHQGIFWSDPEISLALNQSQEVFINIALRLKLHYLLTGLYTTTGFVTPITDDTDPLYIGGWISLPIDYLHYISGRVNDEMKLIARLYLGATAETYRNTIQSGIFIIKNLYRGIDVTDTTTAVELNYFRKPTYIGLTALQEDTRPDFLMQDFSDFVYKDIITNHAAVILGMKETQTQREFKIYKALFAQYSIFPKHLINLLMDVESLNVLLQQLFGKK